MHQCVRGHVWLVTSVGDCRHQQLQYLTDIQASVSVKYRNFKRCRFPSARTADLYNWFLSVSAVQKLARVTRHQLHFDIHPVRFAVRAGYIRRRCAAVNNYNISWATSSVNVNTGTANVALSQVATYRSSCL
jgi:hypothetical protein